MPPEVQPPSSFLPRIKGARSCSRKDLAYAIARLRKIYIHPQVRGSTRRRDRRLSDLAPARLPLARPSPKLSDQDLALLSADPFERSFAIQWLTRLISISAELTFESEDDVAWGVDILEQAASLLAVCAGAAASGSVERAFVFPSIPFGRKDGLPLVHERAIALDANDTHEIRVVLRDAPLESADFSSVGAQTWGGSCVIAEMIAESPENFGIFGDTLPDVGRMRSPFRALELGAGTGLASLVLGKLLERVRLPHVQAPGELGHPDRRELDMVIATDFHPSVLANLKANVEANFPYCTSTLRQPGTFGHPHVAVLPLDWSFIHDLPRRGNHTLLERDADSHSLTANTTTDTKSLSPLLGMTFDIIIGADIIYEPSHARWIRSCVERFLRRTESPPLIRTSSLTPEHCAVSEAPALFHLIIPLRRTHSLESRTVEEMFVPVSDIIAAREAANLSVPTESGENRIADHTPGLPSRPAPELAIVSQVDIVCDAYLETEGVEEVIYRYYKIGWV